MLFIPSTQWPSILCRLKLRPCAHCRRVGTLNAHGYLMGYGENSTRIIRGRRIYCSNRGRKTGCGRTHSLVLPNILPTFNFLADILWRFLSLLASGSSPRRAALSCFGQNNTSRAYWLWKRCNQAQTIIRQRLSILCHPPPAQEKSPFHQVIRHLTQAFTDSPCPIAAYQQQFQIAFL